MQYSRLIDSLIEECIAANLGGYDVADVIAPRATGGDLIREILVKAVCDPRIKSTVRVARAWQTDAHDLLEDFAQGLMDTRGLGREEALERMETFLSSYFFTMVQRISSPDLGSLPGIWPGSTGKGKGGSESGDGEDGEGDEGGSSPEEDEKWKEDVRKARELNRALSEMDSGPEEARSLQGREEGERGDGEALSLEDEQRVELRFLRSIPSSLRRLARIIGRSGAEESGTSGRFLSAPKSDIAGITVGNDLSSLLPSETALLAGRETEDIFLRRFVEKRLQVFASASRAGTEPVRRQDGPVVICLDRSSSMEGRPSDIARALTMAVTIIAKRQGREVAIITYCDSGIDLFLVKNLRRQRKDLIRFLSYGCRGGNSEDELFSLVFREILPREKEFSSADILCVSDFGWSPVGDEVMGRFRESKARGMKVYGLDVSGEGIRNFRPAEWMRTDEGAYPPDIIDSMWIWDDDRGMCSEEKKESWHGKVR
jgi:hypothetical protein